MSTRKPLLNANKASRVIQVKNSTLDVKIGLEKAEQFNRVLDKDGKDERRKVGQGQGEYHGVGVVGGRKVNIQSPTRRRIIVASSSSALGEADIN